MSKQTTVSTPMSSVPPVKGPTSTTPEAGQTNQYYTGKGPKGEAVPQSHPGTGVPLTKKG